MTGAWALGAGPAISPGIEQARTAPTAPTRVATASRSLYGALIDPGFSLGLPPAAIGESPPLEATFRMMASAPPASPEEEVEEEETAAIPLPPIRNLSALSLGLPLPPDRPAALRVSAVSQEPVAHTTIRRTPPQTRTAAVPLPATDNRSFIERLFGTRQQPQTQGPTLAYATPDEKTINDARGGLFGLKPTTSEGTAIYDISARTVYMPNGEKLEAHSGLGEKMDDPRHVHVRMHGATPPNIYNLTMREKLFHGVRALRLTPTGGTTFGRTGLLAHTYMLGPRGDSNGCVSFKNYDRFLQAYLRGEVKRLVVVDRMS